MRCSSRINLSGYASSKVHKHGATSPTTPQATSQGLQLMGLPREIRLVILRKLLLLPLIPTKISRQIRTKIEAVEALRKSLHVRPSMGEVRREVVGSSTAFHTAILRACHTLNREGRAILAENHLCKLSMPGVPLELSPSTLNIVNLNVAFWHIPSHGLQSVQPIMALDMYAGSIGRGDHRRTEYLFEMRDIHFVVRYLLKEGRVRRTKIRNHMDVTIHRIHVQGLCTVSSAAEQLFLRPLYPFLNDMLGTISCSGSPFSFDLRYHEDSLAMLGRLTSWTAADSVLLRILDATSAYRSPSPASPLRWDITPANRLWSQRINRLMDFAYEGSWNHSLSGLAGDTNWEVSALRTLEEIDDQWSYQKLPRPGVDGGPNYFELFAIVPQIRSFVGMGYLNLSHVPKSPSFEDNLIWQRIIASNRPDGTSTPLTPDRLAKEAKHHLSKVPSVLLFMALYNMSDNAKNEYLVSEICMQLAVAESMLRISSTNIGAVWNALFDIFKHLSADFENAPVSRQVVRLRMRLARQRWRTLVLHTTDKELREDGQLRGMWFRSSIARDMLKEVIFNHLGRDAAGIFGVAIFADIPG